MKSKGQSTPATDAARRRLVRGVFGSPAVLGLYSGSVLAASSTKCLAFATQASSTLPVTTSSTSDTYMRVQLFGPNGTAPYFVKGSSLSAFTRAPVDASGCPVTGEWRQFSVSSNAFSALATTTAPSNPLLVQKFAALRFNSAGQLVGIGASGSGSVVGSSCWTSLKT